jgi:hypothetical protein
MPLSAFDTAVHRVQTVVWKVTRLALLVWGVLNGLGIGLIGRVERVSQRISRRVHRVSGTFGV